MPDPEDAPEDAPESRGKQLPTLLFWGGVGLAPIAALLLLVSQGNGPLRIAAVLAVLAVVLIGLSITLRGDADSVRRDIEDTLFEEIDELRGGMRRDIETAARATHRAFGEKLQVVHENVEALQAEVEAMTGRPSRAGRSDGGAAEAVSGEFTRRSRTADRSDHETGGYSRRGHEQASHDRGEGAHSGNPRGSARASRRHADPTRPVSPPEQYGVDGPVEPAANPPRSRRNRTAPGGGEDVLPGPSLAGNVVRHTETPQVTTRQTIVGPHGHDAGPDDAYGSRGFGHGADGDGYPDHGVRDHGAGENDWSSEPSRSQHPPVRGERPQADQRIPQQRAGDKRGSWRSEPEEEHTGDPGDDGYWSSLRSGDRWAAASSDDRGQELQMGERRAALRADESGTEPRVEDRWAAVRREPSRRAEPGRPDAHPDEDSRQFGGREGAPTLPAGGVPYSEGWRDADREPVRRGRSQRDDEAPYGYPPTDNVPRAGRGRSQHVEYPDERRR